MTQETKNLFAGLMFCACLFLGAIIIVRLQEANISRLRQKLALVCLENKKAKECQDEKVFTSVGN